MPASSLAAEALPDVTIYN